MTKEEILTTVKKYGEAAKRVQAIGFDAIEIHCGHSYLMSQFISPYYNKRTDEFGGSVENRLRFPRMVLEEVRKNRRTVVSDHRSYLCRRESTRWKHSGGYTGISGISR